MAVNIRYGGKHSLYSPTNVSSYDRINWDAFIYLLKAMWIVALYTSICAVFFISDVVLSTYSWKVCVTNSGKPHRINIDDDTLCEW
jgi:hypothetical protein